MTAWRNVVVVVVMGLLVSTAGSAFAVDKNKAKVAYRRAAQHYDLGEYREALTDFKEAYREYEDPSLLFNIAQCHRQLGDKEIAIRFYKTYLNKTPNAPNRAEVVDTINKLELTIAEERAVKNAPPQGTIEGTTPTGTPGTPASTAAVTPTPAPAEAVSAEVTATPPKRTPVYKKWWLWTTVGVVAAAGIGVGLGVGLTRSQTPTATTDLGTYRPGF